MMIGNFGDVDFSGKFTVDGMPVPQSFYRIKIESGMVGGSFGILQTAARMSALPPKKIGEWRRTISWNETHYTHNEDMTQTNISLTKRSFSRTTSVVYEENNWSVLSSLISFSVQQTKSRIDYEPLPSKADLKTLLTRRQDLNNGECRKFLESVLKNLNIKKDGNKIGTFEDLYDYFVFKKNKDLIIDESLKETSTGGHTAGGPIYFRPSKENAKTEKDRYFQQMNYVGVLIDELIHKATGSGHKKFASAAYAALDVEEQKDFSPPSGKDNERSSLFSRIFNKKCKINPDNAEEVKANMIK